MEKNVVTKTNAFICIVIVLGFAVTSLISYSSNKGIFTQDVENISTLTSEGIYHKIDTVFAKPINISLTMANDSLLKSFLEQEEEESGDEAFVETMRDYLLAYKEKYSYDSVFLVSAKTNRYYHFEKGVDRILENGDPENVWYYTFLQSQNEYALNIDNDEVASAGNEITVFINCKIHDGQGNIMGVVGVGFRVNYLQQILKEYEDRFHLRAYLVDSDGIIQVSTDKTGFQKVDFFENPVYKSLETDIMQNSEEMKNFWYSADAGRGYMVTRYVPSLDWSLVIDNDTSSLTRRLHIQVLAGILIILLVTGAVLLIIMNVVHKYNDQIVKLTLEKEKKHKEKFQTETEKIYESIYEIDITHKRAASEATEQYFESLGVPKNTPYDEALEIIAGKQIKEEYRKGYIAMLCSEHILEAYESGVQNLRYDFMLSNDEGLTYYWMRITARIFYWDEDESVRMFIYRQNIDQEKKQEKQMIEQMERDSLTGLYNKATTQQLISAVLKGNPQEKFAFYILDIDDFKAVNDTYGHAAGDETLAAFAATLKGQFNSDDIVGRIGGDEFVVFVAIPSAEWARKKAKALSETLQDQVVAGREDIVITASVGVALSPESGRDFESLYKNSDEALYRVKRLGKKGGYMIFHGGPRN